MINLHAKKALLPDGWREQVRVALDGNRITTVTGGIPAEAGDERVDALLPGMANLHSHAFQRAMAGLAERRGPANDSFWSWRSEMYRFALSMSPDHVEAVAAELYMEMLEAGFTRVGEFHYLHHDRDGRPYANMAEMAERIAAASATTGIGLTLLPVFYAHASFGGVAPNEGQRRFVNTLDGFSKLIDGCRASISLLPDARLGIAPHSLRAVTPEELTALIPIAGEGVVHIHIAEQVKEVEDCIGWSGARPVEWLLANMPVDHRWCLIHATHMTEAETHDMAKSGAIAGLCPITEANLGDGIFSATRFLEEGGRFGIGSDSNVQISMSGELRQLEYSQRLGNRARNIVAAPQGSTGRSLFDRASIGGSAALASSCGIAAGETADLLSLDLGSTPYLAEDEALDGWIFGETARIDRVWAGGRKLVDGGRHIGRAAIHRRFTAVMSELVAN